MDLGSKTLHCEDSAVNDSFSLMVMRHQEDENTLQTSYFSCLSWFDLNSAAYGTLEYILSTNFRYQIGIDFGTLLVSAMALVVKVKYEGTLRRFNLYIREDGSPDISLDALRAKICELFMFNPNAQLVITYTDEDNDVVTMADDYDLLDAVGQGLNPLRLEVSLTGQNNGRADLSSSNESSTPRISSNPRREGQTFDRRSIFSDEAFKRVPESLQTALMKCADDHFVKAVASTPAVSEFMEGLIRVAGTHLGPLMGGQWASGASSGSQINDDPLPQMNGGVSESNCNSQPSLKYLLSPSAPSVFGESHGNQNFESAPQDLSGPSAPPVSDEACVNGLRKNLGVGKIYCTGKGHYLSRRSASTPSSQAPSVGKGDNRTLGKLDCCFVEDVTIFDGTRLAPGTPFTKIWRLRNNGTLRWPPHTQLVRVGGDELGTRNEVNLEIQEQGHPVDEELDAAVNLIAPMQPGRYVSYWRLIAPSGQRFGQRVWALIQVEMPKEDFLPHRTESVSIPIYLDQNNEFQGQNKRNMASVDVSLQVPDENASVGDDKRNFVHPNVVYTESGSFPMVKHPVEKSPLLSVQESDVPTQMQGASMTSAAIMPTIGGSSLASIRTVPAHDASEERPAVSVTPIFAGSETHLSFVQDTSEANPVEQSLLHELDDMGFKQRTLNAKILRKNNYDLEKTLDDLCSASEWDTILEELQDMGFCDSEMNKRLLSKNAGSVKKVVLELLSAQKAASSMQSSPTKKYVRCPSAVKQLKIGLYLGM
eukprot:Gb_06496 [translate_table: standard]